MDESGENLYEIDAILGSRRLRLRGFEYRIKYTGLYETSWQPLSDIVSGNNQELLEKYHEENPKRPKPTVEEIAEALDIARSKSDIDITAIKIS